MKEHTAASVLADLSIFDHATDDITTRYTCTLPMDVKVLVKNYEGQFIRVASEDHYRVLDREEMLNTEQHLGLNCVQMGILPLVDCKDNNFLVYNCHQKIFQMINIVDGLPFDTYVSLQEFWKSAR